MMGYLNSFLAQGGGDLDKKFPKVEMPGGILTGTLSGSFSMTGVSLSATHVLSVRLTR